MQSDYQFIPFENSRKGRGSGEIISLSKTKVFVLWKGFLEKNNIHPKKHKYAVLYYDAKENAVAIGFIPNKQNGSFKVTYHPRGLGAAIICKGFLRDCKIEVNKYAGQYSIKKHPIEGHGEAFVIDLKEHE